MWVVQEVTVCKNPPVFYHGAETLEWDILLSFINEALSGPLYTNVYRRINLRHQGHGNLNLQFTGLKSTLMHVRELMKMRSIYQTDEVQTFSDLLIATKDRQSTDPKDKIFALLGLKSPGFPMKVDYNLTEAEVYINATVSALKEENRFDILDRIGCERFKSIKTLPSWVVDFGGRAGTILGKPIKSFSSHAREANNPSLYTAGGPTSRFDRSAVAYVKGASDSDHFLGVGSIIVDIIKKLGTTSPDMDEHLMGNSNGSIGSVIGNWKAVAASLPPLLTSPEQREKDFWRTVLLDLDMPEKNTNADLQDVEERRIPSHVDYLPPKNRSEEEYLVAMLNKKGGAQFSRNFGVTAAGGMGIFPENAKANDRICVFVGGRVPYVIRPWGQRFKLIGECYVDGMMDGEAIEWVRKGRCSTGVIWLV
ncbi:hypothetical protein OIDMADRAFT_23516 [Oidiodendron maius Zn]|uniref:Uncharacterized protein n=1 Tax=Oidiodendron maius (strain Zn) TaxID=913774 RepID=A0A0C3I2Y6_OIDMZ|nr:hypothetical protein OIDMADRAFT_23516 [Oidiodendron maius Zn]